MKEKLVLRKLKAVWYPLEGMSRKERTITTILALLLLLALLGFIFYVLWSGGAA